MIYNLVHQQARQRAIEAVMDAPEGYQVRVIEQLRNGEQRAKFHALCTDLEKSEITWLGKRRSKQAWKVLLISGHAVATDEGVEIVPGLEGEFVNIRESEASMSKSRSSSLIEYTLAFIANHEKL